MVPKRWSDGWIRAHLCGADLSLPQLDLGPAAVVLAVADALGQRDVVARPEVVLQQQRLRRAAFDARSQHGFNGLVIRPVTRAAGPFDRVQKILLGLAEAAEEHVALAAIEQPPRGQSLLVGHSHGSVVVGECRVVLLEEVVGDAAPAVHFWNVREAAGIQSLREASHGELILPLVERLLPFREMGLGVARRRR